jgi:hypothetical protein
VRQVLDGSRRPEAPFAHASRPSGMTGGTGRPSRIVC